MLTDEWLSSLTIYKHTAANVDNVTTKFEQQKGRRLAFCL